MSEPIRVPREIGDRQIFIDGYFGKRILSGETPNYGYPANHLPSVKNASMEVVTGFIAWFKASKKKQPYEGYKS